MLSRTVTGKGEESKAKQVKDEELFGNQQADSHIEGEMFRKAAKDKLKKYWFSLLGKELYCYKKREDDKHKSMLTLVGVFIEKCKEEVLDKKTTLYPFKLIFPNKIREYYLLKDEDREKWIAAIKVVIGYSNLFDFYDLKENLGKGKFGLVKKGVHKQTGKEVAVKIVSKKDIKPNDLELLKREIEIMKMC
jgi:serine/threonine protein kinase